MLLTGTPVPLCPLPTLVSALSSKGANQSIISPRLVPSNSLSLLLAKAQTPYTLLLKPGAPAGLACSLRLPTYSLGSSHPAFLGFRTLSSIMALLYKLHGGMDLVLVT